MPRYGQTDPTEQYQGSAFNPMTGRLSGAQLVMEFLARMEAEKQKKQQAGWDIEDRGMKQTLFDLQKTQAEQGIARGQREARDYQPPESPATQQFRERMKDRREQAQAIERIKATGEEARKTAEVRNVTLEKERVKNTAALKKAYVTAKTNIEKNFTKNLADIEKKFTTDVATIRKDKNLTAITESVGPNPYLIALRGANAARKRMRKELETRKAQEIESLEKEYSQYSDAIARNTQLQSEIPPPPEGFELDIQ